MAHCDTKSLQYYPECVRRAANDIAILLSACRRLLSHHDCRTDSDEHVRLSEDDFELIQKAAAKLWPNAVLSNSGIVLGLARLAAKQTLDAQKKSRPS
jgi:hypothetical protein